MSHIVEEDIFNTPSDTEFIFNLYKEHPKLNKKTNSPIKIT